MKIFSSIHNFNRISFSGYHNMPYIEGTSDKKGVGYLNHTTSFFRYPKTDEFIVSKIKKDYKDNPIKIISVGCSYGEEVYSYSMLLDDLAQKIQIDGIDLCDTVIEEAKKGKCQAIEQEAKILITEPEEKLSDFEKTCRRVFNKHYTITNPESKVYVFEKKQGHLENCTFKNENISDLTKSYPPKSADIILCRYVLYQLKGMGSDNDISKKIIKQLYEVLKMGGLLVFAEDEEYDGLDDILFDVGFQMVDDNYPNIYKKG